MVSSGRVVGFTRVVYRESPVDEKSDERVLFSKRVCARVLSVTILLLCDGAHLPPASSSPMMTLSSRRRTTKQRALLLQRQAMMHSVLVFSNASLSS